MLYFTYRQQPKKRLYRTYFLWSLIPLIGGLVLFAFATNRVDSIILGIQNTIESIPSSLEAMRERNRFGDASPENNTNYLEGIPIKEILRGGDRYEIEEFAKLPSVDAEGFVVGDVLTGEIIIEKNPDEALPVASLTKLMTASVALDELKETHVATVSQKATLTESSRGMLRANEKIEVSDLLYPLLLVSSNDSAEVLAETFGRKYFIQSMNRRAKEIGMTNTSFDDPSGLSEHNISTARDMFKLSEYLFNNHSNVFEITKLKEYAQGGRVWKNANRFAGTTNYEGGKTGYTSKAHRTGVALFKIPIEGYGERVVAISLLRTDNRAEDYGKLLAFLNDHVRYANAEQKSLFQKEDEQGEVNLVFLGDLMFDRGVKTSVEKNFEGDYGSLFENLGELRDADIAFANLEGPISDRGTNVGSKYSFRFEPKIGKVLKDAGIDIVSFANNHVGDWSLTAFQDTLSHLKSNGVLFAGAGETKKQAHEVTVIESRGIKIGFLAFSDVGPTWIEASDTQAGQLLASDPNRLSYIEEAKKKVDILVVSYHWGDEYKPHNERQKSLAYSSIDSGADLIIGHHPHVIQDTEVYKHGLIAYSLGNAVFDQHFSEETMEGMLLHVSVNSYGIVNYEEKKFILNESYQPQKPEIVSSSEKKLTSTSIRAFEEILQIAKEEDGNGVCPKGTKKEDLFLFNASRDNAIPKDFVPNDLVTIPESLIETQGRVICIKGDTLEALYAMYKDAQEDGISLIPTSGYRSFDTQEQLFTRWKKSIQNPQYLSIAEPGHSEHHLGTTLDFTSEEINFESASQKFETSKAYEWLKDNAHLYGFVQSYKDGTEPVTGYIEESWHWRYLGPENATAIRNLGITTLEYLGPSQTIGG